MPTDPDKVVALLRNLATKHGWVLARWSLSSPELHDGMLFKRWWTPKQRAAILNPKRCSPKVVPSLIRKGVFNAKKELTPKGKLLQIRLKKAIFC